MSGCECKSDAKREHDRAKRQTEGAAVKKRLIMTRNILTLFLIVSLGRSAWSAPPDEVNDALAQAEALYYEAQFAGSIKLLLRADQLLQAQPERLQEKIKVKLQLALANVGLNDSAKAKSFLRDLYALDANYSLDAQQFSPKVMALAAQAKAEQDEIRCQAAREDARKKLNAGNAKATFDLIGLMKPKCDGLTELEPELAELFYKMGFDAFKRGELPTAIQNFQTTLKLVPKHELASQYVELTQTKLQVNADRLFLQWQKDFDSHAYVQAAVDYRLLLSLNDEANAQMITAAQAEYRKALTDLVESWNRACMRGDGAAMNSLTSQLSDMLPEPSFGEDIRGRMTTCTKNGCLQMSATLAMARVKTRVNPSLGPALQEGVRGSQITVFVKGRIDESGNFDVTDTQGGSPAVNTAVSTALKRWKFSPIIDENGSRCVDTEIPIVLKF
jgi:tetratricopeptide (TPR) repeat protein